MTIAKTASKAQYSGDGSTVVFSFPYRFFSDGDLQVYLLDASNVETLLTLTTHYTVSNSGDETGGAVTMVTAPASGETLTILRDVSYTQPVDYAANDAFPAETHEKALDRATLLSQQIKEVSDRALIAPVSDTASLELPIDRAGKFLAFDASKNPIASAGSVGSSGIAVSAYMETLLDDVDAATARATLGSVIGTDVQAWDAQLDTLAGISADNATAVGNLTGVNSGDEVALAQSVWDAGTDTTEATLSPLKLATVIGTHTVAPDYVLEKAVVAGATTVDFTAEDLSRYYRIVINFEQVVLNAAAGHYIVVSDDGGATWLSADYSSVAFDPGAVSGETTTSARLHSSARSNIPTGTIVIEEFNVARRARLDGILGGKAASAGYTPASVHNALRYEIGASTFVAGGKVLLRAWK